MSNTSKPSLSTTSSLSLTTQSTSLGHVSHIQSHLATSIPTTSTSTLSNLHLGGNYDNAVDYDDEVDANGPTKDFELSESEVFALLDSNLALLSDAIPASQPSKYLQGRELDDFQRTKEDLVNLVSASLLNEPKFYKVDDKTRQGRKQ